MQQEHEKQISTSQVPNQVLYTETVGSATPQINASQVESNDSLTDINTWSPQVQQRRELVAASVQQAETLTQALRLKDSAEIKAQLAADGDNSPASSTTAPTDITASSSEHVQSESVGVSADASAIPSPYRHLW